VQASLSHEKVCIKTSRLAWFASFSDILLKVNALTGGMQQQGIEKGAALRSCHTPEFRWFTKQSDWKPAEKP
jgi:hypothetical protein